MAESSRNLERTGLLLLAAAVLGFAAVVVVPRLPWTATTTYSFVVPLDRGIQTLAPGSSVFAAGLAAGEVVSIAPISTTPSAREADALRVVFEVPKSFPILEGAEARLVSAVIGSETNVVLIDAFTHGRSRLADGAELPWLPPPNTLELIFGTTRWQQLRDSIARFERLIDEVPAERRDLVRQVGEIRDQVAAVAERADPDVDLWKADRDRLVDALTSARAAADRARQALDALHLAWQSMTDAFHQVTAKLKSFFPAAGGNMEDIQLLQGLPDTRRLDGQFSKLVDAAGAVAPAWRGLLDLVGGPWEWARQDFGLSKANMTLAVGQFQRIKEDLERDPIPALLQTIGVLAGTIPDQDTLKKMEADEALRRFVMATADLRAANASIAAWVREAPSEGLADPVPPDLRAWFERSQAEFAEAADALFRMRMNVP